MHPLAFNYKYTPPPNLKHLFVIIILTDIKGLVVRPRGPASSSTCNGEVKESAWASADASSFSPHTLKKLTQPSLLLHLCMICTTAGPKCTFHNSCILYCSDWKRYYICLHHSASFHQQVRLVRSDHGKLPDPHKGTCKEIFRNIFSFRIKPVTTPLRLYLEMEQYALTCCLISQESSFSYKSRREQISCKANK